MLRGFLGPQIAPRARPKEAKTVIKFSLRALSSYAGNGDNVIGRRIPNVNTTMVKNAKRGAELHFEASRLYRTKSLECSHHAMRLFGQSTLLCFEMQSTTMNVQAPVSKAGEK